LVGGHSAEAAEMGLGFAVTGRAPTAAKLLRKGGLAAGDRLILTKPLGTGIILAADGRALAPARAVAAAIAAMLESSAAAARCLVAHGAAAATDVTGFGLLGHLLEMLIPAGLDAVIDPDAVPVLDGARELLEQGIESSLAADNRAALAALDAAGGWHPLAPLLVDPQTAGGLLAGIAPERASPCLDALCRVGCRARVIGRVERSSGPAPRVRLEAGVAAALPEPVAVP
jgi:selenide,water dikinase